MDIVNITAQIDARISELQRAKAILAGTVIKSRLGRPKASHPASKPVAGKASKPGMSPEGKAKIAAAQKIRWAKVRKAAKKAAKV